MRQRRGSELGGGKERRERGKGRGLTIFYGLYADALTSGALPTLERLLFPELANS